MWFFFVFKECSASRTKPNNLYLYLYGCMTIYERHCSSRWKWLTLCSALVWGSLRSNGDVTMNKLSNQTPYGSVRLRTRFICTRIPFSPLGFIKSIRDMAWVMVAAIQLQSGSTGTSSSTSIKYLIYNYSLCVVLTNFYKGCTIH